MSNEQELAAAAAGSLTPPVPSAGSLLREARQRQGLHIAALASAIKVAPRKLELLEADRLDELPDATFTRALAQTVCRFLKVDAAPILALLPPAGSTRLHAVGEGLNAPFFDRPDNRLPTEWSSFVRPAIWAPVLLLLAAGAVYWMPTTWLGTGSTRAKGAADHAAPLPMPASAASNAPAASSVLGLAEEGALAPAIDASVRAPDRPSAVLAPATSAASDLVAATLLQLQPSAASWVEVRDANGKVLLSRLLKAGEHVELDGTPPLRLSVGNAEATAVVFRGQSVALAPFTRDNLARFELK